MSRDSETFKQVGKNIKKHGKKAIAIPLAVATIAAFCACDNSKPVESLTSETTVSESNSTSKNMTSDKKFAKDFAAYIDPSFKLHDITKFDFSCLLDPNDPEHNARAFYELTTWEEVYADRGAVSAILSSTGKTKIDEYGSDVGYRLTVEFNNEKRENKYFIIYKGARSGFTFKNGKID